MDGHDLREEDLRLMYTFDQSSGSAAQYEAHSDAQVGLKFKPIILAFDTFASTLNKLQEKSFENVFSFFNGQMPTLFKLGNKVCSCLTAWGSSSQDCHRAALK